MIELNKKPIYMNVKYFVMTLFVIGVSYVLLWLAIIHNNKVNSAAPTIVDTKHKTGIIVTDQNDSILVNLTSVLYKDSTNVTVDVSGINCDIQVIK